MFLVLHRTGINDLDLVCFPVKPLRDVLNCWLSDREIFLFSLETNWQSRLSDQRGKEKKSIILLFTYILKSNIKFFSVKLTHVFFITLLNTYLLLIFKWKRLQDWQRKVWNGISFDKILRRLRNSKKTQGKKMKSCKRWKMKNWLFVHIWKWVIFGSKAQRLF